MSSKPTMLKQPIALRTDQIASEPTTLRVKQHTKSWSGGDYTIFSGGEKLFSVGGHIASWSQRRNFCDASGLPLFELGRKKTGVTWFLTLPGDSSQRIATLAPRFHAFKDKFDVHLTNAAADGAEVTLEVRGQDIWKVKTEVRFNGALVMTCKLRDKLAVYMPIMRPEWEVEVAEGMDVALASVITVLLAELLYCSSMSSTHSSNEAGGETASTIST